MAPKGTAMYKVNRKAIYHRLWATLQGASITCECICDKPTHSTSWSRNDYVQQAGQAKVMSEWTQIKLQGRPGVDEKPILQWIMKTKGQDDRVETDKRKQQEVNDERLQ
jgi:hypothetical protein